MARRGLLGRHSRQRRQDRDYPRTTLTRGSTAYPASSGTVVLMGYPNGEIPMLSVHGQTVAGATLPGPDLACLHGGSALSHKVLGFECRTSIRPTTRDARELLQPGSYYSPSYSAPTTSTTNHERGEHTGATPPPFSTKAATPKPMPTRSRRLLHPSSPTTTPLRPMCGVVLVGGGSGGETDERRTRSGSVVARAVGYLLASRSSLRLRQ